MKRILSAAFFAASICAIAPASAGQINFDSLPGGDQLLPSNYAGFNWSSDWAYEDQTGYNNNYGNSVTFPSAPNVGFNGFGAKEVDLFASNPTVFTNAMVATWAENNQITGGVSSTSITVEGWNGATEEWSVTEQLGVAFQKITFGTAAVTELKFFNDGSSDWWLIDNINYGTTAVPEPGSLALLCAGLAGLGGWRLRRKVKSA